MSEEKFSPQESLMLIQSMIDKTKKNISENGIYFLVWGWITFIAFTGQFILKHYYNYPYHYQVWYLIIIGILFSIFQSIRDGKKVRVKSYVSESIKYLWIGMAIAYFVLSMILTKIGWDTSIYPFFIMLYGLGTFISGSIIKFRPLVIGGLVAFALAIGAAWAAYDYQMLFGAAAILISYIIPAYILRARKQLI